MNTAQSVKQDLKLRKSAQEFTHTYGWSRDMWSSPIAVPSIGKPFESGRIGTAFDYVARAILERQVGSEQTTTEPLVCGHGLAILLQAIGQSSEFAKRLLEFEQKSPNFPKVRSGMSSQLLLLGQGGIARGDPDVAKERAKGLSLAQECDEAFLDILAGYWEDAMETKTMFIAGKASIADYSRCALFLAELDVVYRAASISVLDYAFRDMKIGRAPEGKTYFSQYTSLSLDEMATNITALASKFEQFAKATKMMHVVLNPTFEQYSVAVGGADADFIYDTTLIDLKTSGKIGYVGIDWAQVLGYAAMAQGLGTELSQAGIYFARFDFAAMLRMTPSLSAFLRDYLNAILATAKQPRTMF